MELSAVSSKSPENNFSNTYVEARLYNILIQPKSSYIAGSYMFKVNNRNIRARCEICSKLTPCSSVSIVNFG